MPRNATPSGRLGVHILGPGYGESTVLELPDGTIAIFDTFVSRHGRRTRCPVLDFVRREFPGRPLSVLAVTHPHADHCMGAARIARELKSPRSILVFHAYHSVDLQTYFYQLVQAGLPLLDDDDLDHDPLTIADELLQVAELASRHKGTICLRAPRRIPLGESGVEFSFLTPGDDAQRRYLSVLSRNMKSAFRSGGEIDRSWRRRQPDHNLASGALLVTYRETRLLLLADAIGPLWAEWVSMADPGDSGRRTPAHLVKVSHHGSLNGYHEPLFEWACDPATTVAIVTPFDRHAHPLPSRKGLLKIRRHVKEILCTNREAALASTGDPWIPVSDADPDWSVLLHRLKSDALARRRFRALARRPDASAEDFRRLIWEFDGATQPASASGRSSAGNGAGTVEDDYRISLQFNDRGEEVGRHIGCGVGRLWPGTPA